MVSTCFHVWLDEVVPLAMKFVGFEVNALHLFIAYCAPGCVFASIESAGDFQSLCRGRPGDEIDDCFVIPQWLSAPV